MKWVTLESAAAAIASASTLEVEADAGAEADGGGLRSVADPDTGEGVRAEVGLGPIEEDSDDDIEAERVIVMTSFRL